MHFFEPLFEVSCSSLHIRRVAQDAHHHCLAICCSRNPIRLHFIPGFLCHALLISQNSGLEALHSLLISCLELPTQLALLGGFFSSTCLGLGCNFVVTLIYFILFLTSPIELQYLPSFIILAASPF